MFVYITMIIKQNKPIRMLCVPTKRSICFLLSIWINLFWFVICDQLVLCGEACTSQTQCVTSARLNHLLLRWPI